MIVKVVIALVLIFMIYNLFRAMMIMIKNEPGQPSMTKFIGRRVLASAVIMLLLMLAIMTGLITPNPRPF
jgi:hypothetical protein